MVVSWSCPPWLCLIVILLVELHETQSKLIQMEQQ